MAESRRFCENCGTEIGQTTNFCPNCGAAQRPDPEMPTDPPPTTPQAGRIPTSYAPDVPPPPQPGGGSRAGRWIGGCIVVLLVLIGLVTCAALVGGGGDEKGEETTTGSDPKEKEEPKKEQKEKAKEKDKQKQESAVGMGQPVDAGDIEWTIADAQRVNQLSQDSFGQFGDIKQGDFVVVELSFRNNGSDSTTLTTNSLTLLDSNDREFRPDTDTFGYIDPQRNILLEQVNPGVSREGTVIFSVSPDASGFRLRLGDASLFGDDDAYVDLGF